MQNFVDTIWILDFGQVVTEIWGYLFLDFALKAMSPITHSLALSWRQCVVTHHGFLFTNRHTSGNTNDANKKMNLIAARFDESNPTFFHDIIHL
jgi:hypothetical protein